MMGWRGKFLLAAIAGPPAFANFWWMPFEMKCLVLVLVAGTLLLGCSGDITEWWRERRFIRDVQRRRREKGIV